jgi:hypothetical protein
MTTKTEGFEKHCWFMNNNLIVPKLNEQYILKKDLSFKFGDNANCNYPSGMVVKVVEYIPNKECLIVRINTQSIPEDKFPLLHENLNSLLLNFHSTNILEVSQFYDYFEEFDKDMTMADVLDIRQAMDKFYSAVKEFNRAINDMDGDCNSLITDEYPFGLSFDEFSLSFMEWYNSVDNNCNAYRHAIKTVRDDESWKDYDNRVKMSGDNPTGELDNV